MSKYNAFDAKLLGLIREGIGTFGALAQLMLEDSKPFCKSARSPYPTKPWRIVDRRLQALRKAGEITYAGGYWRVIA